MADNEKTANNANSLLRRVPHVLRARGYRLYTAGRDSAHIILPTSDNRRLIDLWLNGGTALLGHTPTNVLRELKNTASRGLYAPYPHFTEGRLLKALSKLLPGYSFRLYSAVPPCCCEKKNWRPFSVSSVSSVVKLIIPTSLNLCVIAFKDEADLPPSDILPPLTLAVAARAVHDLIAAPDRATPHLPRTFKALKESTCPWQREAIYLTLKNPPSQEEWSALFDKFLAAGFLLPPTPDDPLILPGELSDGEDAKLAAILLENTLILL